MGDWDGVRQPAISARLPLVLESDLGLLRRRLPFLHHVEFGGQVGPVLLQVLPCGRGCAWLAGCLPRKKLLPRPHYRQDTALCGSCWSWWGKQPCRKTFNTAEAYACPDHSQPVILHGNDQRCAAGCGQPNAVCGVLHARFREAPVYPLPQGVPTSRAPLCIHSWPASPRGRCEPHDQPRPAGQLAAGLLVQSSWPKSWQCPDQEPSLTQQVVLKRNCGRLQIAGQHSALFCTADMLTPFSVIRLGIMQILPGCILDLYCQTVLASGDLWSEAAVVNLSLASPEVQRCRLQAATSQDHYVSSNASCEILHADRQV